MPQFCPSQSSFVSAIHAPGSPHNSVKSCTFLKWVWDTIAHFSVFLMLAYNFNTLCFPVQNPRPSFWYSDDKYHMQPQQCNLLYPKYHSKVSIWHFGISMFDLKLRYKSPNFALKFSIFILDSSIPRWKLHPKSNPKSVWYTIVWGVTAPGSP